MHKTTLYIPNDLRTELRRASKESGKSEAEIIREGIRLALERYKSAYPTIPIYISDDPHFAENVDDHLVGFGQQ